MDLSELTNGIAGNDQPIPNPIPNGSTDKTTNQLKRSPEEVLGLDLRIAEGKKFFMEQIALIFHLSKREQVTFAKITKYLVDQCQAGVLQVSIFHDAIEWARQARSSNAANKKGLFVAKIKEETGFHSQNKMLLKK